MLSSRLLLSLFAFSPLAISTAVKARSEYGVKETHFVPREWERINRAPADHVIHLKIALKQGRFDELEKHLYEVSDPYHRRYGQHLRIDEINDLVKPPKDTADLVHEWLTDNGVDSMALEYSPAGDWISMSLPVNAIEQLLQTEYTVFKHREDGSFLVRSPEWSLPRHLHDHVETIQPTNSFFQARKHAVHMRPALGGAPSVKFSATADAKVVAACNDSMVTPLCLRTFYGTVDYKPKVPGKNKIGLADYLNETNNRSDAFSFLQNFRPEAAQSAYNFTVKVVADGNSNQGRETPEELAAGKGQEGNLDAQTILSQVFPTPLIAYATGGQPPFNTAATTPIDTNEPYLTWINYVLGQHSVPQVISTSYGDDEQTVPFSYAKVACNHFAQLGARGITLLFSSGDFGVGPQGKCLSNDGKNTTKFIPSFPATCPYITVVGGTAGFTPECAAYNPHNTFSSGGGFSNYFIRPAYQNKVVPPYVKDLNGTHDGLYNQNGRAYPDISAQGRGYAIVWDGQLGNLDGTSASTPTAASILSLVNDARLAAGKKSLGWLNPWLYTARGGEAFTDITCGRATGCGTDGFPAKKGWDPVTGFGTPYFPKVLKAALAAGWQLPSAPGPGGLGGANSTPGYCDSASPGEDDCGNGTRSGSPDTWSPKASSSWGFWTVWAVPVVVTAAVEVLMV
ncbi:MAG: hypothetical protein Q9160_006599 [Pyrenula sp. 1 TL-2023]